LSYLSFVFFGHTIWSYDLLCVSTKDFVVGT
jgi:hypothetical protein